MNVRSTGFLNSRMRASPACRTKARTFGIDTGLDFHFEVGLNDLFMTRHLRLLLIRLRRVGSCLPVGCPVQE